MIQRRLVAITVLVAVYRPYPTKESEWERRVEGRIAKREEGRQRAERERKRPGLKYSMNEEGKKKERKERGDTFLERGRG